MAGRVGLTIPGWQTFNGTGVFLTERQLSELRRAMLLPVHRPGESPYELVDRWARERNMPPVSGHWGVHLESGELLEP